MKTIKNLMLNQNNLLNNNELKQIKGGTLWCGVCGIWQGNSLLTYGDSCDTSTGAAETACENTYRPLFGSSINCTCGAA